MAKKQEDVKCKRSYCMPERLVDLLESQARESGMVREAMVAAGTLEFINKSANERSRMLKALADLVAK